ncbi:hypothetical protein KVR01_008905 [Diaporthe batatas]|uniref:uncharacterized protein n=1 Tax=Diaporthe batatas TaxID=748121 RepID=UPI001D043914|nr:uncharacterized protein KVR01_008905 [Diaporthe batatas]KAG8160641.1 hypothetical protein KVR01_008905 [Diaporthe batatas]
MAELIGAISAGIGIASFALQVGKGINNVQKAIRYNRHHASADFESLESDLNNLYRLIEDLRGSQDSALVSSAVANCQHAYTELEPDLDRLTEAFGHVQSSKSSLRSLKRRLTLHAEEHVKKLRAKVRQIEQLLILITILVKLEQLDMSHMIAAVQRGPTSSVIPDVVPAIGPTPTPIMIASEAGSPVPDNTVVTQRSRLRVSPIDTCYHKETTCAHGRFWWLELTSTPGFWHKCSPRCPARCEWNAKLRLALTWLNIPFAVTASLGIASSNGQYALRPALSIQHVVRNTSPGFLAIELCKINALSVEESKQRLRDLSQTDKHFRDHVNPEGKGYLRHLVSYPWWNQKLQFSLLDFLLVEIGLDFSSEDPRFLIECSKWFGEGRHLDLLDTVLEHGFSPNGIDAPAADQWPEPCNPDWSIELYTPDPFFLEYFTSIVRFEPGFAGVTELQKHILMDTFHTLLDAGGDLPEKDRLFATVNFLGQSSLHLAVRNIHTVKKLVELGHNLNVTDRWGTTPLMYAAAMGCEDVTIHLLLEGALSENGLYETRFGRTFLEFAIVRGHWNLVHKTLSTIREIPPEDTHHGFAQRTLWYAMTSSFFVVDDDTRRQHIPLLIQQCEDVNFTFDDRYESVTGNNLMHYVRSIEEAEALVARGFNLFNTPNSAGRLSIHSWTFDSDPALMGFCVKHGTRIDHVDSNGQTLLFILLSKLGDFDFEHRRNMLRLIRHALHLGADASHSDGCRCPCSPGGCSSSAFFATGFDSIPWFEFTSRGPSADLFWIFEWQSILRDFHGEDAVKTFCSLLFAGSSLTNWA